MTCASCGAPVDVSAVFPGATVRCPCGASVVVPMPHTKPSAASAPRAPVASSSTNSCPRCDGHLDVRHADGIVVAACARGHGLFMTHAVLHEAERKGSAAVTLLDPAVSAQSLGSPAADDPTLACPRCGETMARSSRGTGPHGGSVIVDVCAAHGTWFDAGELRAALGARAPTDPDLEKRAKATLDVALALEQAREEETMRRVVDTADDVLDTFDVLVFGVRKRRREWYR